MCPRACLTLGLGCNLSRYTNTVDLAPSEVGMEITPNPAQEVFTVKTASEYEIQSAILMDVTGKQMRTWNNVANNVLEINRNDISGGAYFIKLKFKQGESTGKVILK